MKFNNADQEDVKNWAELRPRLGERRIVRWNIAAVPANMLIVRSEANQQLLNRRTK